MNLIQWAIKWGVSMAAVEDLRREFGLAKTDPERQEGRSESAVQSQIRIEASSKGARLWRNNVGGAYTEDGSFFRYGLCNESKQMNAVLKSSDLIGISPLLITQNHVGSIVGQFLAREVKESVWTYSGTDRELAQLNFLNLVASLGGNAAFANSEGTL